MLGLINWRLRDISKPASRLLMTNVSTCVNCHSFSSDGKTMGMDVDGPDNDRALYAMMPVRKETLMNDASLIKWSTFQGPLGGPLRVGFMSQVSPDGNYVLTTINDPRSSRALTQKSDIIDRYYVMNFLDYKFVQVFYPTRGILAWYSKETGRLQPLPGADDESMVQACGVWSPDGKYIVFARSEARSAYPEGREKAQAANDPQETQIQYDLYRIPFNGGKGGTPERIVGASQNGMSNNFPKVSPDGRWIVFVQNRNGLLMRPDSKLYIVPFEGGTARPLNSNTPLMNSWHSFSPNGRWLVFSSKARSPYTQMYLTHIDEDGNDSPAILIENATAANRAVNIPEFVNIAPDSWLKMEAPMADFFHELDVGLGLAREGKLDEAIHQLRKALQMVPGDARGHYHLALALDRRGDTEEAIAEFRKALEADPTSFYVPTIRGDLALALAESGRLEEAVENYARALEDNPGDARARSGFAAALMGLGRSREAATHARVALEIDPDLAEAHNTLGIALAMAGNLPEALTHLRRSVDLKPDSFQSQFNLGRVLAASGQFQEALPAFQKAVELSGGKDLQSLNFLSAMYSETARWPEALETAQRALKLAEAAGDLKSIDSLRERIAEAESRAR
jgi:tetratricopeptide (TPR) repeat protein